jgi:hypothetical protein
MADMGFSMKARPLTRRAALIALTAFFPMACYQVGNAAKRWPISPELEDLAGDAVVKRIAAELQAVDRSGRLQLSHSTREDLDRFFAADEVDMPVRMPTELDKNIILFLFTYSTLPE